MRWFFSSVCEKLNTKMPRKYNIGPQARAYKGIKVVSTPST